jgi:hypothetical protein
MQLKHFLILTILLTFGQLVRANELVIEVTTDKWPKETSWILFDTDQNEVKKNGILLRDTTYRDTVQLDENSCYYWTIYDTYGNGLSNGPGNYRIYLDGVLVDSCQNPDFGYSISVYGLGSNCVALDAAITELTFLPTQQFNPFDLTFDVFNFGSEIITALDLVYSIDGVESDTISLSGLSISFGQKDSLAIPNKLQFLQSESHQIGLRITKANGLADQNTGNNYLEKTIQVEAGYRQKPMHEEFTANWCGPCALANPILKATLNQFPGQYSLIKYQGKGDTYYHSDGGYMETFYGELGYPSMYVNAINSNPGDYTPEKFESYLGILTNQFIIIDGNVKGDSVFASVNVNTLVDLNSVAFLRLAVIENITTGNIGTNGEEEFENVFMKFLSNKAGTEVGQLKAGADTTLSFSASLAETFIEEFTDLKAVAYLFYKNSYKILQSEMVDIPYAAAPPYITFNIQNGAVVVDTLTTIELVSDKKLFNSDGSEITDANPLITFKMDNNQGEEVSFNAVINSNKTAITVTPTQPLKPNTTYYLGLSGVQSQDGVEVTNATIIFTTEEAVGAPENPFASIQVYPNPVNNELHIISNSPMEISIADVTGRTVMANFNLNGNGSLDFSTFVSGFYFVQLTVNNQIKIFKVAKR